MQLVLAGVSPLSFKITLFSVFYNSCKCLLFTGRLIGVNTDETQGKIVSKNSTFSKHEGDF